MADKGTGEGGDTQWVLNGDRVSFGFFWTVGFEWGQGFFCVLNRDSVSFGNNDNVLELEMVIFRQL